MDEATVNQRKAWAMELRDNPLFQERVAAMKNGGVNAWVADDDDSKWFGYRHQVHQGLDWDNFIEGVLAAEPEPQSDAAD
jgi:hypothetical protein